MFGKSDILDTLTVAEFICGLRAADVTSLRAGKNKFSVGPIVSTHVQPIRPLGYQHCQGARVIHRNINTCASHDTEA